MEKERYVGTFYNNLAQGKFVGQRCDTCGAYQLFPMPVCSQCQGTSLKSVELSREAKLLYLAVSYVVPPRFSKYAPFVSGCIQLKEGPVFWGIVEGIDMKNPEKELARLPLDIHIEMKEIAGNVVPIGKVK